MGWPDQRSLPTGFSLPSSISFLPLPSVPSDHPPSIPIRPHPPPASVSTPILPCPAPPARPRTYSAHYDTLTQYITMTPCARRGGAAGGRPRRRRSVGGRWMYTAVPRHKGARHLCDWWRCGCGMGSAVVWPVPPPPSPHTPPGCRGSGLQHVPPLSNVAVFCPIIKPMGILNVSTIKCVTFDLTSCHVCHRPCWQSWQM